MAKTRTDENEKSTNGPVMSGYSQEGDDRDRMLILACSSDVKGPL